VQAQKTKKRRQPSTGRPNKCQCTDTCPTPALKGEAFCSAHMRSCPRVSPLSGSEPRYEPGRWNGTNKISDTHNCFSYAMNVNDPKQMAKCKSKTYCNVPFHQPGFAAGYRKFLGDKPKTCPNMLMRIMGDNPHIRMTSFTRKCPPLTSKIALVVDQSEDYHFFRQDSNRFWSHKPGARDVTNVDAGGHRIWDPRLADLDYTKTGGNLKYDVFCSYMCVPRTKKLYLRASGGGKRSEGATKKRRSSRA
jgi:hypothetical protein